jgi:signal transduction histidine kinase
LANYLCHVAQEFFGNSAISCRLDVDDSLPEINLKSEARHNLYLAVREALNNTAKHSKAAEVWLRIHWQAQMLQVQIEDNGTGFNSAQIDPGNGLLNMRRRLERIGGRFEIASTVGSGTVCRICLPLTEK